MLRQCVTNEVENTVYVLVVGQLTVSSLHHILKEEEKKKTVAKKKQ